MSAEIPYWWQVTTQIWGMLLIGCGMREICLKQSEAQPRSQNLISMEFLQLFPRCHSEENQWWCHEMSTLFLAIVIALWLVAYKRVACEQQTFLLAHCHWGTVCEEERLRLSDRNSILMMLINVYIINPVVMGFQMQICSILRFSWSIFVKCWRVHLRMSPSKTQVLLLEKTIFHKYWLFC